MSTAEALFFRAFYQIFYNMSVLVLTIIAMSQYKQRAVIVGQRIKKQNNDWISALIIAFLFAFFIGIRPHRGFEDTGNYVEEYEHVAGQYFEFDWSMNNYLFDNMLRYFSSVSIPVTIFFIVIAILYFVGAVVACKKMFPNNALLSFVTFLGAFSTYSYGTNGIKAGAAASLFLIALAYKDRKLIAIFFLWLSLGIHHSMIIPIVAYVASYFFKKDNLYLYFWIFSLILAAAHITIIQTLFMGFADDKGAAYLDGSGAEYVTGFRPDFILYSVVPIIIGYYLIKKKHLQSSTFSFLWRVYTLSNSVFLLCTYAEFINRIAYLSWLMYPFVLLYPFVNITWASNQKKLVKRVVYGHLGFTLFMVFVYYGI